MQAIILCGGKGTRLSALYSDRPKILVPIAGRPFLEWQFEWLGNAGITDIHLAAGYKADVLADYATRVQGSAFARRATSDKSGFRIQNLPFHVSLSTEPSPLGTGGGLKFVEPWVRSDPFLVLNGDSLSPNLDFRSLQAAHREAVTIAVTKIGEAGRYGTVEFDGTGRVTAFLEKAPRESGWINAGVYLIDRAVLAAIPADRTLSIETDVFPELVRLGRVRASPTAPPMLDMGTPAGIAALETYLQKVKGGEETQSRGPV